MARSFAAGGDIRGLGADDRATFFHQASNRWYTVYRQDRSVYLRRHQIGFEGKETNVVEARVDYVLGSGNHARGLIHRAPDGRLMQLPVAWYAEDAAWAMAPGYDRPDHPDFRRVVDDQCMFCHNAYPAAPDLPQGIDCERCHGPGAEHARIAQSGADAEKVRSAVLNPARLPPERQLEICMQCHLQPTSRLLPSTLRRNGRSVFSYDPREPLSRYMLFFDRASPPADGFEVNHTVYRLRQSACFRATGGRLVCTTCHNPHEVPSAETAERACQGCHTSLPRAHNADRNCAACHMPKRRTEDAVHVIMTDHRISRRPPPDPLRRIAEQHDDSYRGEVVLYYPPRTAGTEYDLDLAVAQVRDGASFATGIPRLERAIERNPAAPAEYRFDLAEAYRNSGNATRAAEIYAEVVRQSPALAPAWLGMGQALVASGQPDRAVTMMEGARHSVLPSAPLLNYLGAVAGNATILRQAIALAPELPEPHLNLGVSLSKPGTLDAALAEIREAIRLAPDLAAAHNNLAYLLAARGRSTEAEFHFAEAIRIDPNYWAAHLGYARLLAASGRREEAARHFRQAARSPEESMRREAQAALDGR